MLIGLLLAAASTSASGKINMSLYGTADFIAVMSPFIVVAAAIFVPVLDLVMAVVRRVSKGRSPFSADKMHLHHRLLELGHTHRRVVLVLYTWVSVVAFGAVSFTVFPSGFAFIGVGMGLLIAAALTVRPALNARRRNAAVAHRKHAAHAR